MRASSRRHRRRSHLVKGEGVNAGCVNVSNFLSRSPVNAALPGGCARIWAGSEAGALFLRVLLQSFVVEEVCLTIRSCLGECLEVHARPATWSTHASAEGDTARGCKALVSWRMSKRGSGDTV